jgi:hypothetical protein
LLFLIQVIAELMIIGTTFPFPLLLFMGRIYNTTGTVNAPDTDFVLPTGDLMPHARTVVGIRTLAAVERPAHSPILPFMRL